MLLTSAPTMSSIVTEVGTFVTTAVGWIGQFGDTITENTFLKISCIAVPLVGLGAGLLVRLIRGANA